jgi:hypothetical protein
MAGGLKLKFIFYFMATTYEPLNADKWSFVEWKIVDVPTSFVWNIIFFNGAFQYGRDSNLWGYVGTNTEPLCLEFCNFKACKIYIF